MSEKFRGHMPEEDVASRLYSRRAILGAAVGIGMQRLLGAETGASAAPIPIHPQAESDRIAKSIQQSVESIAPGDKAFEERIADFEAVTTNYLTPPAIQKMGLDKLSSNPALYQERQKQGGFTSFVVTPGTDTGIEITDAVLKIGDNGSLSVQISKNLRTNRITRSTIGVFTDIFNDREPGNAPHAKPITDPKIPAILTRIFSLPYSAINKGTYRYTTPATETVFEGKDDANGTTYAFAADGTSESFSLTTVETFTDKEKAQILQKGINDFTDATELLEPNIRLQFIPSLDQAYYQKLYKEGRFIVTVNDAKDSSDEVVSTDYLLDTTAIHTQVKRDKNTGNFSYRRIDVTSPRLWTTKNQLPNKVRTMFYLPAEVMVHSSFGKTNSPEQDTFTGAGETTKGNRKLFYTYSGDLNGHFICSELVES